MEINGVHVGLSSEQIAKRRNCIGASDAGKIMAGEWADLWLVKTGRKEPDDLSGILPVQLGSWTEAFNRAWYSKLTGLAVSDAGRELVHPEIPYMTCTLDGMTILANGPAVVECKHVSGREPLETVIERYQPQLQHQMVVANVPWAVLSVLIGTDRYEYREIERDEFYIAALIEREHDFWMHVETDTAPPDMPAIAAPVPPEKLRKVDFTGNNEWGSHASAWIANKGPAKLFKDAEGGIKGLMELDIGEGSGHSIICKRAKNGSLRIQETKNASA